MGSLVKEDHKYVHKNKGVCAAAVTFEIEGTTVHNVEFIGGCSGNTQGVARLVEGMEIEEVIKRVEGIRCGMKPTSCPDQLAKALKAYLDNDIR